MFIRSARLWTVALGIWISGQQLVLADTPSTLRIDAEAEQNQRVADAIARHLRQSGHLRRFNIDITFQNGVTELHGHVADAWQHDEVLRLVQGVPGVAVVRDRLTIVGFAPVVQTQTLEPPTGIIPGPMPSKVDGGPMQEPVPIFQAPQGMPQAQTQPPRMPPYAWPSTAPYNNYSRVGYPTLYPYEAFPFIGPCYPFPKVPLGWRSVTLEWKDGFWWYGQNATGHDFWRIRYW